MCCYYSFLLFSIYSIDALQALNPFELLLFLCTKSFLKFSGFLNLENLCYSSSSFSSLFAEKNSSRTNRLNSFCVSLLPFPKEQRTKRLNYFVSPFFLVKEFNTTQSENSFDSSHSLIQKCSKD